MKRFIGVFTMSHENNGVRALPPGTCETGKRFRTPFLVCEDSNLVFEFHVAAALVTRPSPRASGKNPARVAKSGSRRAARRRWAQAVLGRRSYSGGRQL